MRSCSLALALALALLALLPADACTSERSGSCGADADCAALISSGEIEETHARCHPIARFCYPGCAKNEDCERWRFGPWCDHESGHCSDDEPDGGAASDAGDAGGENP